MGKKKDYRVLLKTPFQSGFGRFSALAEYFLYYAPNIDSAQSSQILTDKQSRVLLEEMLKKTSMKENSRFLKKIQPASWGKSDLDGYELDFETPRMLCDLYSNENELHALLRHIRNALAHGYLYPWKKKTGNYVLLIDYDAGRKKKTAMIMVNMQILETWKTILETKAE